LVLGQRVGIPQLGQTCGQCAYCKLQRENLRDQPLFTGFTRDGGFGARRFEGAAVLVPGYAAVAAQAQAIITRNLRDVLRGELKFPSLSVLTPEQCLEVFPCPP
jgi:D-arabinose 1-dehydrogenase-like Zn-dependent alcohol dehydrogenase